MKTAHRSPSFDAGKKKKRAAVGLSRQALLQGTSASRLALAALLDLEPLVNSSLTISKPTKKETHRLLPLCLFRSRSVSRGFRIQHLITHNTENNQPFGFVWFLYLKPEVESQRHKTNFWLLTSGGGLPAACVPPQIISLWPQSAAPPRGSTEVDFCPFTTLLTRPHCHLFLFRPHTPQYLAVLLLFLNPALSSFSSSRLGHVSKSLWSRTPHLRFKLLSTQVSGARLVSVSGFCGA